MAFVNLVLKSWLKTKLRQLVDHTQVGHPFSVENVTIRHNVQLHTSLTL